MLIYHFRILEALNSRNFIDSATFACSVAAAVHNFLFESSPRHWQGATQAERNSKEISPDGGPVLPIGGYSRALSFAFPAQSRTSVCGFSWKRQEPRRA